MENFRDLYEHHWVIEMSDEGIVEAEKYFSEIFKNQDGDYFICNEFESKKASLHSMLVLFSLVYLGVCLQSMGEKGGVFLLYVFS